MGHWRTTAGYRRRSGSRRNSGGAGSVFGSLIGALLMAHLRNLCVHLGLPNYVQEMVVGAVIVVAVAVDRLRQRRGK